jgi:hypothetical protein
MIFCGQCGLQQAPGATRCPRCGTAVEGSVVAEEYYVDDPTMVSFPYVTQPSPQPGKSSLAGAPPPQKLVLGGDNQSTLEANAPTSKVDGSNYNTQLPSYPSSLNMSTPYAGYPGSGNYSPPGASYPATLPASTGSVTPVSPYQPIEQSAQKSKGRAASLVIILFGLLLILGAMIIFALKQNGTITGTNNGGNTLSQQAQTLIEQYYNDINNKDYQDAYNLRGDLPQQSYTNFQQGYAHTQHVEITFGDITALNDGTAKVSLTLRATDNTPSGIRTSVFNGYYIVGPQNGVLKILSGQLSPVS